MRRAAQMILPGTGRGTMRSMVEGAHVCEPAHSFGSDRSTPTWAPSTAFGGPRPRAGEECA
jgi:hypothetical protein